jgi:hypothetical protein
MKKFCVLLLALMFLPTWLGAQTVFDNTTVNSTYVLSDTVLPTVANVDTAEAFSTTQFIMGPGLRVKTFKKVSSDLTATLFEEPNATALTIGGRLPDYVLTFILRPSKGVTFKPTNISFKAFKNGTGDQVKIDVMNQRGEAAETLLSSIDIARNNEAEGYYTTVSLDITDGVASNDTYILKLYPWGKGMRAGKGCGIGDLVITGVVHGTVIPVPKYTITPLVSPEGAGEISINPPGTLFDEGTELNLIALRNFGFEFSNWKSSETLLTDSSVLELVLMSDTTVTAHFTPVSTYELAITAPAGVKDYMFDLDPAFNPVAGKKMYETGSSVLVSPRSNAIMNFTGWAGGNAGPDTTVTMTANVILEADYDVKSYLAGWDFYVAGNKDRPADFASAENQAAKLSLINEAGTSNSWLDKSEMLGASYEGKYGAVNWKPLVDKYYYQTCVNASMFNNIKVVASMLYNYNAYQKQLVEYSLDGTNFTTLDTIVMSSNKVWYTKTVALPQEADYASKVYIRWIPDYTSTVAGTASSNDGTSITDIFVYAEGLKTDAKAEITDSVVVNPNFDTNITGWTSTTGASSNKIATNQTGDFTGPFWENWKNTSFTGKMSQIITGLPNGSYLLRAAAFCNNGGDGFYLFANSGKTQVQTTEPTFHEVVGVVTDGKLEIGLLAELPTNNWVGLDNVKLYSLGFILNDMITALEELIVEAEAITGDMQASVATGLADAISNAEAAVASRSEVHVVASLTALRAAIDAAYSSIALYAAFPALQTKANYIYSATAAEAEALQAAITTSNDTYVAKTANQTTYDNLVAAMVSYRAANDVTAYVVNPDMTEGKTVGWASDFGEQTAAYPGFEGRFLEKWVSAANNLADFNLSQIISDLPNGTYTLSAWCIATKQNQAGEAAKTYVKNVYLYANNDSTPVSSLNGVPEEFMINVTVADNTLKLGFTGINCTANWIAIDKVRLMSHDVSTLLAAKQVSLNALIGEAEAVVAGVDSAMLGAESFKYAPAKLDALNAAIDSAKVFAGASVNEYVAMENFLTAAMNNLRQMNQPLATQFFYIVHSSLNHLDVADGVKIKTAADTAYYQWFKLLPIGSGELNAYHLKTLDEKFVGLTGTNNWDMSAQDVASSDNNVKFIIEMIDGSKYKLRTIKGLLGTDAVTSGSGVYGNKAAGANSEWSLVEVGEAVYQYHNSSVELKTVLDEANAQYDSTLIAADEFAAAIAAAQAVYDKGTGASVAELQAAVVALNEAIAAFEEANEVPPIVINKDDYVAFYSQDYEFVAQASDVWTSPNNQAGFSLVEEAGNKYINYDHGNVNSRGAYSNFDIDYAGISEYLVEFDLALTAGNNQATEFALKGTDFAYAGGNVNWGAEKGYLFKLSTTNSTTWTIVGSGAESYTVELNALEFYHFLALVRADGIQLTITDAADSVVLDNVAITLGSEGIECVGLHYQAGRYQSKMKIDNILLSKPVPLTKVTWYMQDYENVASAADVWTSPNNQAGYSLVEEEGNKYIYYNHGNVNSRGSYSNFEIDFADVDKYILEFDLALKAGNNQATEFAVKGTDFAYTGDNVNWGAGGGYLFKLFTTNSTTWTIAGSGAESHTVELNSLEFYHYSAEISAEGILLTITNAADSAVLDKAAITSGSAGIECVGLYYQAGRYQSEMKIDNIAFSKLVKGVVMVEPTVLMTGVSGISRIITMLSTQPTAILKYVLVSAEDYEAAVEIADVDTTKYQWQTYTAPFMVDAEASYLLAYATDGSVNSALVKGVYAAGTEIAVNAPVISLIAVNGTAKTYAITSDNSDVLFAPVSVIHYEYGTNSGVYSGPLTIDESCTLTATASTEGYASASTSIAIDGRTNYRVAKSYDFTQVDQAVIDTMLAHGWTASYDSLNVLINIHLLEGAGSDKNADNLFYYDQDSVKIQYFPDFAANFDSYELRTGADGKLAGLYSQSSGGRAVTVSNITAGQFVEFIIENVSYIVKSTSTSCSYTMDRYKTLQKVNVFIPDIYLDVNTVSIDITAAGNVNVEYDKAMNIAQNEVLSITGTVNFSRVFGSGYEPFVAPFNKPVIMDADSNVLVRGTDYVIRRLSSGEFVELGPTANIVANTVGYVIKVAEKYVGQPITFVYESETGFELGIAQTTFNAPSSGIAYRTNRRFIPHALGSDTTTVYAYVMNEEGTAFVKTANPVIPAFQACIMADSTTLATIDEIKVEKEQALNGISQDRVVVSREYFDLSGTRLLEPGVGINIERIRYEDGAIEVKKIIIYAR